MSVPWSLGQTVPFGICPDQRQLAGVDRRGSSLQPHCISGRTGLSLHAQNQHQGGATMGSWLSEREQRLVAGAETASASTPIPTQIVSNGEFLPPPQSETQKRVERRILDLADTNGKRLGLSRRQFMQTGCGMAAAFLAMNEIYGTGVFQ